MRWDRLRRPDWLGELRAVLILGLLLTGGATLAGIAAAFTGPLQIDLPATAVAATVDYGLHGGAAVAAEQEVTVGIADPDTGQRVLWVLDSLPTQIVIAAMLALLLMIVNDARRADPFTLRTVRRLRILAIVALAGGHLAFFVEMIARFALSESVLRAGVASFIYFPSLWLLIGFGLLAVAEVVRRGCSMRSELEAVI
jgi:hypothetical protein